MKRGVKPRFLLSRGIPFTTNHRTERPNFSSNLQSALKRVRQNKGSAGVDGMSVDELPVYLEENWSFIREKLLQGSYKPMPVKSVEIPRLDGGGRLLGIPTVLDRFIQQALAQILQNGYDKKFSDTSYGFRPKDLLTKQFRKPNHIKIKVTELS
jgi:RNA-directed DNA polymerase